VKARNDDAVLVPEGYHPVTSAPGCTTYTTQDPRVPIYDVKL
jgi:5-deoxy-D-glucuronate isomerase